MSKRGSPNVKQLRKDFTRAINGAVDKAHVHGKSVTATTLNVTEGNRGQRNSRSEEVSSMYNKPNLPGSSKNSGSDTDRLKHSKVVSDRHKQPEVSGRLKQSKEVIRRERDELNSKVRTTHSSLDEHKSRSSKKNLSLSKNSRSEKSSSRNIECASKRRDSTISDGSISVESGHRASKHKEQHSNHDSHRKRINSETRTHEVSDKSRTYREKPRKASSKKSKDAALATFNNVRCYTSRSRLDLQICEKFLGFTGHKHDFQLRWETISQIFHLPHEKDYYQVVALKLNMDLTLGGVNYSVFIFIFDSREENTFQIHSSKLESILPKSRKLSRTVGFLRLLCHFIPPPAEAPSIEIEGVTQIRGRAQRGGIQFDAPDKFAFIYPLKDQFLITYRKRPICIPYKMITLIEFITHSLPGTSGCFDIHIGVEYKNYIYQCNGVSNVEYAVLHQFVIDYHLPFEFLQPASSQMKYESVKSKKEIDCHEDGHSSNPHYSGKTNRKEYPGKVKLQTVQYSEDEDVDLTSVHVDRSPSESEQSERKSKREKVEKFIIDEDTVDDEFDSDSSLCSFIVSDDIIIYDTDYSGTESSSTDEEECSSGGTGDELFKVSDTKSKRNVANREAGGKQKHLTNGSRENKKNVKARSSSSDSESQTEGKLSGKKWRRTTSMESNSSKKSIKRRYVEGDGCSDNDNSGKKRRTQVSSITLQSSQKSRERKPSSSTDQLPPNIIQKGFGKMVIESDSEDDTESTPNMRTLRDEEDNQPSSSKSCKLVSPTVSSKPEVSTGKFDPVVKLKRFNYLEMLLLTKQKPVIDLKNVNISTGSFLPDGGDRACGSKPVKSEKNTKGCAGRHLTPRDDTAKASKQMYDNDHASDSEKNVKPKVESNVRRATNRSLSKEVPVAENLTGALLQSFTLSMECAMRHEELLKKYYATNFIGPGSLVTRGIFTRMSSGSDMRERIGRLEFSDLAFIPNELNQVVDTVGEPHTTDDEDRNSEILMDFNSTTSEGLDNMRISADSEDVDDDVVIIEPLPIIEKPKEVITIDSPEREIVKIDDEPQYLGKIDHGQDSRKRRLSKTEVTEFGCRKRNLQDVREVCNNMTAQRRPPWPKNHKDVLNDTGESLARFSGADSFNVSTRGNTTTPTAHSGISLNEPPASIMSKPMSVETRVKPAEIAATAKTRCEFPSKNKDSNFTLPVKSHAPGKNNASRLQPAMAPSLPTSRVPQKVTHQVVKFVSSNVEREFTRKLSDSLDVATSGVTTPTSVPVYSETQNVERPVVVTISHAGNRSVVLNSGPDSTSQCRPSHEKKTGQTDPGKSPITNNARATRPSSSTTNENPNRAESSNPPNIKPEPVVPENSGNETQCLPATNSRQSSMKEERHDESSRKVRVSQRTSFNHRTFGRIFFPANLNLNKSNVAGRDERGRVVFYPNGPCLSEFHHICPTCRGLGHTKRLCPNKKIAEARNRRSGVKEERNQDSGHDNGSHGRRDTEMNTSRNNRHNDRPRNYFAHATTDWNQGQYSAVPAQNNYQNQYFPQQNNFVNDSFSRGPNWGDPQMWNGGSEQLVSNGHSWSNSNLPNNQLVPLFPWGR